MNAEPQWIPREPRAIPAIDNLRSAVILLVVTIHVLLPYFDFLPARPYAFGTPPYLWRSFPLIDPHRLPLAFDILSAWVDVFVMATFFLISGLFVWPCLARKGPAHFVADRALRLGLPFAVAVLLLMPLATLPTYLQSAHSSATGFWQAFLALPFWPAGPMWFLWMLLAFDLLAAGTYALFPGVNAAVMRLSLYARAHPWRFGFAVLAASALAYIPLALIFGPLPWGQYGPFSIQLCRPAQYAVYFVTGVVIGAAGMERTLIGASGHLARHWKAAAVAAAVGFALWLLLSAATMTKPAAPAILKAADAAAYVLACLSGCWAAVALAARFAASRGVVRDSLRDNTYGIYLVHCVIAFWLQFALLDADVPAAAKAGFVFVVTLALSWGTAAVLRRLPGFAAVIGSGRPAPTPFHSLAHPAWPLAD